MSVLSEILSREEPYHIGKIKNARLYRLVQNNIDDIDEALRLGYSWEQIMFAFEEAFNKDGKWGCKYSTHGSKGLIPSYYKRIKQNSYDMEYRRLQRR